MDFAELISASRSYLTRFDADNYPACFQAFEADAAPLFAALAEQDPESAAAALIDTLERQREALPRRARKLAAEEEKRVLALFFSPAAVRLGGRAADFAEVLCRQWNARYPRNLFFVGDYETLLSGFAPKIMGIPIQSFRK